MSRCIEATEVMARRVSLTSVGKKRVYSGKYALSSIVFCGHCGDVYRRIKWNNRGCRSTVWRCVSRVEKDGPDCPARTIKEEDLQAAVLTAVNDVMEKKDAVIPLLKENILAGIDGGCEDRLSGIDGKIRDKQKELLEAGNDTARTDAIGEEIISLREERQAVMTETALRHELTERMEEMTAFLDEQPEAITEYSDALVRRLIEKVTIFDEKISVEFKSGLETEVDA